MFALYDIVYKMSRTISVRLDESLLKDLSIIEKNWQADKSEAVRRLLIKAIDAWKIQNTLEKLREHKTSIGKAAKDCNISLWEMLDLVKENNIDWTKYGKEDLEKDLKALEGRT